MSTQDPLDKNVDIDQSGLQENVSENEAAEASKAETNTTENVSTLDAQEEQNELLSAQLKEEIESLKNNLQRERAEFANFRKRTMQERLSLSGMEAGKLLTALLPALDSFDSLLAAEAGSLQNFIEGTELIRKQILSVFAEKGVQEFEPQGQEFDPEKMEALSVQESDEVSKEVVSQVFQKGYLLDGKVLRAARVVVARPVEKTTAKESEDNENNQEEE